MTVRLLTGDCRAMLTTLPDASVQCCVTSPPYFGLRDYGTASWDGGDAECDHIAGALVSARSGLRYDGREHAGPYEGEKAVSTGMPYRSICGKCGARRIDQQIGLESTVDEYVGNLVEVFREVKRVLRDDGTLWLNLGDSYANSGQRGDTRGGFNARYFGAGKPGKNEQTAGQLPTTTVPAGLKPKDLIGIPWRVAFALQAEGWWLRSDIIWNKPNPMPESVRDRPTKSHDYIFLLSKSARYFWDAEAVKEPSQDTTGGGPCPDGGPKVNATPGRAAFGSPRLGRTNLGPSGRNIRSVWTIATHPYAEAHFATFPPDLAERCIKAGTSEKGACSACGAPWVRVIESTGHVNGREPAHVPGNTTTKVDSTGWAPTTRATSGWQPSCTCDADVTPCVVLDCFAGAGTVSLVAERLGRDSIGVELNGDYVAMAEKRIRADCPMFATVETN